METLISMSDPNPNQSSSLDPKTFFFGTIILRASDRAAQPPLQRSSRIYAECVCTYGFSLRTLAAPLPATSAMFSAYFRPWRPGRTTPKDYTKYIDTPIKHEQVKPFGGLINLTTVQGVHSLEYSIGTRLTWVEWSVGTWLTWWEHRDLINLIIA